MNFSEVSITVNCDKHAGSVECRQYFRKEILLSLQGLLHGVH